MNRKSTLAVAALAASLISLPSLADHNSVWGAGFANMPNDIHNTRLEDNLSQDEWRTFVQKGAGAEVPNRYLDTSATSVRGMSGMADRPVSRGVGKR